MSAPPSSSDPSSSASLLDAAHAHFAELVRRVAWRHRLSSDDVEEVLQDVRIRLWKASQRATGPSEQNPQSAASYVYRTAVSAAIDLIRRRRAERAGAMIRLEHDDPIPAMTPTADADLEAAELAQQVERAIETIPSSRRQAVRMHLAGYSREDIADLMGWSEAKTRNLVYRGLDDLRRRLTELGLGTEARR